MFSIEEMRKWDYKTALKFFNENAVLKYCEEAQVYVRDSNISQTIDLRDDKNAREKILASLKSKTLVLVDGSSLSGKSTFAKRLAPIIDANIVDIDIICQEFLHEQLRSSNNSERFLFLSGYDYFDKLSDQFLENNLENIIREKSTHSVILVGSYMELLYRTVIAKTLGKYFSQVVSIYFNQKNFKDVSMMLKKRNIEFGYEEEYMLDNILENYRYAQRLLESGGILLGIEMNASFISDTYVSDMFMVE